VSRATAVRVLLAWLALGAAVPGAWATVAPRGFYDGFPGVAHWVDRVPPYSAHLTADVGAFYLAFAVLFAWAARRPARELVVPLCLAWSLFSVLHLVWHVAHLDGFGAGDAIGQTASLATVLVLPLAVVALLADATPWRAAGAGSSRPPRSRRTAGPRR
jgi:hypothetical protein